MARQTVGWWKQTPQLSRSQVDQTQIQAQNRQFGQTMAYNREGRDWQQQQYLALMDKLFGTNSFGGNNSFEDPLQTMIAANSPTGPRMDAYNTLTRATGNQTIAADMVGRNFGDPGTSNRENAGAIAARAGRDSDLANLRGMLGFGAQQDQGLLALSQGRLTQQQIAAQSQAELMRSLSMFGR